MSNSYAPPRRFLFGPGPTQVEARVYEAMAKPLVGYLDPYLFEVFDAQRHDLRAVFGTRNPCTFAVPGTGSAGMETVVSNFTGPGTKFAVFVNGFFGERIAEMGRRHGATVVRCEKPWGQVFREDEARAFLERERPQVVAFVHAETSTGALQPPQAIARPAHEIGALTIADCVTSLGAMPVNMDANGIDIAYSCSQKGLSCPPGLAPLSVSEDAFGRRRTAPPIWYLDLKLLRDYFDDRKYHHTAPVSTHYALAEGLAAIREEGIEQRYARHARAHAGFASRIESLGLKMHVAKGERIPTLNTVSTPAGADEAGIRKQLLEQHGIEIAAGFGPLAGKIFRIGLMGPLANDSGLDLFFEAFSACLAAVAPA